MLRIFAVIVLVMSLLALPTMAQSEKEEGTILTYQTINTSGSAYQATAVPVTSIYPGDRILGWSVLKYDNKLNAEHVVSVYDQTSTAITSISGECLGESEAGSDQMLNTIWLPFARTIEYGIVIWQGPNTVVTIYFAR